MLRHARLPFEIVVVLILKVKIIRRK